ncbi:MAG: flagellar hook-basal body complex protein FliE [Aliarcobacter sp.]|nr:flagellar hook-basal body complex protein FliE [Aliarcobacter sp.]
MNISSIGNSLNALGLIGVNKIDEVGADKSSFQSMLSDAISDINNQQVEGYKSMEGIATGKVTNLQEAVQRIEEAELSLKLGLEVKNKALNAYKEIMRMQI